MLCGDQQNQVAIHESVFKKLVFCFIIIIII